MLQQLVKDHQLILASGSPRRHRFLSDMGLKFTIAPSHVEEVFPPELQGSQITDHLVRLKASGFAGKLEPNQMVITADTIVLYKKEVLGKPEDREMAIAMLQKLSGDWHEVISSIGFTTTTQQKVVNCITRVKFHELKEEEIAYYVDTFQPMDKAGAYGIQEWIGAVAIETIEGSYNNVVGLPTHLFYTTLQEMLA